MLKIGIEFSLHDFEYDVYSLVKAFYPAAEVKNFYSGEEAAGVFSILIAVDYAPDKITLTLTDEEGTVSQLSRGVIYDKDRKETKNVLKQMLYELLSEQTGQKLPWGTLTGIRPTKIPMQLIEEGWRNVDIADYLRKTYFVSNEKTSLAVSIANRERAILKDIDYEEGYSLYIGIPFCPSICLYCSFGSHPLKQWEKRVDEYLDALIKELAFTADLFKKKKLQSIYIGGGTPTTLSPGQSDRLLSAVCRLFDLSGVREFTLEAGRPDTITREKLEVIKNYPVTRISVNPQTMNQKTLDLIGRKHTVEDIKEVFFMARELGFDNINMDLIVGLPGEGYDEVARTLEEVKKLSPESLTVHSLALKRATRLNLFKDEYAQISFENSQRIMQLCELTAMEMGMGPYYMYRQKNMAGNFENVGYAKVDKAGIYNILIMEEKQSIAACGAGASTKFVFDQGRRIERVENVKSVEHYIARIDEMLERKREGAAKWLH